MIFKIPPSFLTIFKPSNNLKAVAHYKKKKKN